MKTLKTENMNIREFAKLDLLEKAYLLKHVAILIDSYMDKSNLVKIYTLNGFFVEATINPWDETIVDIIPFRRGFLFDKNHLFNSIQPNMYSYVQVA
jgi:hypothetical protein